MIGNGVGAVAEASRQLLRRSDMSRTARSPENAGLIFKTALMLAASRAARHPRRGLAFPGRCPAGRRLALPLFSALRSRRADGKTDFLKYYDQTNYCSQLQHKLMA